MTITKTHPWLTFGFDMREFPYTLWLLLGEAASKIDHIASTPLLPQTFGELHRLYLAKGVLATTAIEGNTMTEEEVLQFLNGDLKLPKSRAYQQQEVQNVSRACTKIGHELLMGERGGEASIDLLNEWNRNILVNLPLEEGVAAGEIRKHKVMVSRYRCPDPNECPALLAQLVDWLNNWPKAPEEQPELSMPLSIVKAILAHLYMVWIHPYGDGNGRTARLVEFQVLIAAGVPTPVAHLLSNHYNRTRTDYYRQLDAASRSGGDIIPFLKYAVQGLVDGLAEQLDKIWDQQLHVFWRVLVDEALPNMKSITQQRQKEVLLGLLDQPEGIPTKDIPMLTPQLGAAYAKVNERQLQRDLGDLVKMGLLIRHGKSVRVNVGLVLHFLPPARDNGGRASDAPSTTKALPDN